MHSELVVLGGGPGGYAAAFLAADLGIQVTLVDADARLGGVCLLRGCIPSKALLHVSKVISEARELAQWGVEYDKPRIDVASLRERKNKIIQTLSGGLEQLAKKRNVQVVQARGSLEDSTTLRLQYTSQKRGQGTLSFEHCILAVGSSPAVIAGLDIPSNRVMDSTTALELPDVPESLLVIGGGYIGLEMGAVYAELGSRVTVVEMTDGLLPGVDRDLVKPLAARLKKQFEAIHLNTKVVRLVDHGEEIEATLEGPKETAARRFSRVLVSVGRTANSRGIGLENTEVALDDRGFVVVDDCLRTTDSHILAIGDVVGEPMLAHKASHQGKVAVEALAGGPAAFEPAAIPAVVFTDPEIAWAGLTEEQAKNEGRDVQIAKYPWAASGRARAITRTEGLTKLLTDPGSERVLGAGLVGPGAGELVGECVLAIEMGCTVRDLAETIHQHPTLSETIGFAADVQLGVATEVYRPKRSRASA